MSLFSQMDHSQRTSSGLTELQQGNSRYQEIMLSIKDDSRLLSLLGKRRGKKGFRDLQGEQLRQRIQEAGSMLVRCNIDATCGLRVFSKFIISVCAV